jgi:hypothetical protein
MADATITIRLYDANTNKPLKCKEVDSAKALFCNLDTGVEILPAGAPKGPKADDDPVVLEGTVPADTLVGSVVEVSHKAGGTSLCRQVATILRAGSNCEFNCAVPPAQAAEKIANYRLKAHFCRRDSGGAVVRGEEAEITKAWAERVSTTTKDGPRAGDNRAFHAILQGKTASFGLPTDATYAFYFETKNKHCSNPALTLHVCCEGNFKHDLCLTACERVVTVHLSDPCGKPVLDSDAVVLEAAGGQVDSSQPGKITVTGVEEGRTITLQSKTHDLSPHQHRVGEPRNQNLDVVASVKTHSHASFDREEILVTIDEQIKSNEDAWVKFLDANNVLVTTLKAESGKPVSYHAPRGKPLKIQLLIDGKVTDEAIYPSSE